MAAWLLVKGLIGGVSPTMWKYIGIGLAFAAVFGYADRKATYRERAACEAAAQRAQDAANKQDAKAGQEVQQNDTKTVAELNAKRLEDNAIIEHLKVQLAKAPLNAPCYYPDVGPTGRVPAQSAGKRTRN